MNISNDISLDIKIETLKQRIADNGFGNVIELNLLLEFYRSRCKNYILFGDNNNGQYELLNRVLNSNVLPDEIITLGSSIIFTFKKDIENPLIIKSDGTIIQFDFNEFKIEQFANQNDIIEVVLTNKYFDKDINISTFSIPYRNYDSYKNCKISCADKIVFTIMASQSFSLSQKDLLRKIADNSCSEILIAVTGLELVKKAERAKVEEYFNKVKNRHFPTAKILFFDITNNESYLESITKLKNILFDFSTNESILKNRAFIINKRLNHIIDNCIETLENKKKIYTDSLLNKKKEEELNREKLLQARLYWEDLRIEFEKRANNCLEFIYDELYKIKKIVSEQLQYELLKSNNPKEWWINDLPFRIKKEFTNNSKGLERLLQNRIIGDYRWLVENVRVIYAKTLAASINSEDLKFEEEKPFIIPKDEELKDLKLIRYITMASTGAASVAMFFVVGPIGAIVSAAGGIFGDRYITREIQSQQEKLKASLDQIIDSLVEKSKAGISEKIHEGYDKIIKATVSSEEQWENGLDQKMIDHPEEKQIISIEKEIEQLLSIK